MVTTRSENSRWERRSRYAGCRVTYREESVECPTDFELYRVYLKNKRLGVGVGERSGYRIYKTITVMTGGSTSSVFGLLMDRKERDMEYRLFSSSKQSRRREV